MKMILGILNSDDAPVVIQNLNKAGYFVTRLSTSGGFLRAGNVTWWAWKMKRSARSSTSSTSIPAAASS